MRKILTFLCAEKAFTVVRVHYICHLAMVLTRLDPCVSWFKKWVAAPVKLFFHPANTSQLLLIEMIIDAPAFEQRVETSFLLMSGIQVENRGEDEEESTYPCPNFHLVLERHRSGWLFSFLPLSFFPGRIHAQQVATGALSSHRAWSRCMFIFRTGSVAATATRRYRAPA